MSAHSLLASLIWATRGRSWGFRFLLDGGQREPLVDYERMFAGLPDEPATWHRAAGKVALRFPDPLRRTDSAGRVIPHEFVVSGELAEEIDSVEDGVRRVWPLVDEAYARVWDAAGPPSAADLGLASQRHALSDADRRAVGDPERTAPS